MTGERGGKSSGTVHNDISRRKVEPWSAKDRLTRTMTQLGDKDWARPIVLRQSSVAIVVGPQPGAAS